MHAPKIPQEILIQGIPEYIPPPSPQQLVWLESYKATMQRSYYTNSDACGAAEKAVKEFNKLFKGDTSL